MSRVWDEAWIAVIFVLKWLALVVGVLLICYSTVRFLYHSLYCDPKIAEFEAQITRLRSRGNEIERMLVEQERVASDVRDAIGQQNNQLAAIAEKLTVAEAKLTAVRTRVPIWKQIFDDDVKAAKEHVSALEDQLDEMDDRLEVKEDELEELGGQTEATHMDQQTISEQIQAMQEEKSEVCKSVGFVVPLSWIFAYMAG